MAASSDTSQGPPPAALRTAMRPLLRTVIRRPGELYQPLYIGPIPDRDVLEPDVQGLCETEGLPAYFGLAGEGGGALMHGSPGVLVVGPKEGKDLKEDIGERKLQGRQIIIHADQVVESLDQELLEWIGEEGLAFDPTDFARSAGQEGFMGPTLARCAQDPGRLYNPILLLGGRAQLEFAANEVLLRLEAGGLHRTLMFGEPIGPDEPEVQKAQEGQAVIIRLTGGLPEGTREEQFHAAIESMVERNVQVVLVAPSQVQEEINQREAWKELMEQGITLTVAGDRSGRSRQEVQPEITGKWPNAVHYLVEPPKIGRAGETGMSGRLSRVPLSDVTQMMSMGRQSARMVIFAPHRLGAIDLEQGSLVHASMLGDRWSLEKLRQRRDISQDDERQLQGLAQQLVQDRICRMGLWQEAHFAVFYGGKVSPQEGERVELPVDSVMLEVAQRTDEVPRVKNKVGGMERIWKQADEFEPADPEGTMARLWPHLDGEKSLREAADQAGVFDFDALDAVVALNAEGRIEPAGEKALPERQVPAYKVAGILLQWGLVGDAQTILLTAEKEPDGLSAEGYFLLAHLQADSDPMEAAKRFRKARKEADDDSRDFLGVQAILNALLLEVRNRETPAEQAWKEAQARLKGVREEMPVGYRHKALLCELAIRGRKEKQARRLLRALRETDTEEANTLADALASFLDG